MVAINTQVGQIISGVVGQIVEQGIGVTIRLTPAENGGMELTLIPVAGETTNVPTATTAGRKTASRKPRKSTGEMTPTKQLIVEYVTEHPGANESRIAAVVDATTNTVKSYLPSLVRSGHLKKIAGKFYAKDYDPNKEDGKTTPGKKSFPRRAVKRPRLRHSGE